MFRAIKSVSTSLKYSRKVNWSTKLNSRGINTLPSNFKVTQEIQDALSTGKPVVALESTIISHGMPYPQNVNTALEVEGIIREQGAIPATIALMNGNVHIGLESEQLELLAQTGLKARKVSRRDLAFTLSQKLVGATTVASTMILAHRAGIPIFVTGGIGGVHRGVEKTMDISADLTELGRTPITVICAGAKSILDIGCTLEYLETQGVAVATYGNSEYFPGFFVPESKFKSPIQLTSLEQATDFVDSHIQFGLQSGVVIGVPIPKEFSKVGNEIQAAIEKAVIESQQQKIEGKNVTPFLLERVNQLTQGRSLSSNISLVKNNAKFGGKLAVNLASKKMYTTKSNVKDNNSSPLLMIGGCGVDVVGTSDSGNKSDIASTSTPGKVRIEVGGVASNIARTSQQLGCKVNLLSAIGNDMYGDFIIKEMKEYNIDTQWVLKPNKHNESNETTAVYHAIHTSKGQLFGAIADMSILEKRVTSEAVEKAINAIQPKVICFDGNLSSKTIENILKLSKDKNIITIFEPTSVPKSLRIFNNLNLFPTFASPNQYELLAMYNQMSNNKSTINQDELDFNIIRDLGIKLSNAIPYLVIKMGSQGVLLVDNSNQQEEIKITHLPPPNIIESPISVSGAGDSLVGALSAYINFYKNTNTQGMIPKDLLIKVVDECQNASSLTLMSHKTVAPTINFNNVFKTIGNLIKKE